MSRYRHTVRIRWVLGPSILGRPIPAFWIATCPVSYIQSNGQSLGYATHIGSLTSCHEWASKHAATCEALHRANLAARCRTCDGGALAHLMPTCPDCDGRGWTS